MSHQEHDPAHAGAHAAGEHHTNYVKIWAILLVLLCVSVVGPFFEIKWVTLITAFGVALVKAFLVARDFMHLNVQRPFVVYLLVTVLALMVLLFGAVAPDIMKHDGQNWENVSAKQEVERGQARGSVLPVHGAEHGEGKPAGGEHHEAP